MLTGKLLKGFTKDNIATYITRVGQLCGQKADVFWQAAQASNPNVITIKSNGDPRHDLSDMVMYYQQWPDGSVIAYAAAKMVPETDPNGTESVWMNPDDIPAWVANMATIATLNASSQLVNKTGVSLVAAPTPPPVTAPVASSDAVDSAHAASVAAHDNATATHAAVTDKA